MLSEQNVRQDSLQAWLLAARPKTLSGAAVPVMIGVALAFVDAQEYGDDVFSWTAAALCLLFAFIMQIDANFVNDFFDYAKGNDDSASRLGPLRACTQGWVKTDSMKQAIASTTVLACLVGLPLVYYGGLEMILVGLLCVVFCFLYTTHLSYMGLGDVLVLVFFGIVPVCCTYYIQLHTLTWQVFVASIACGLVIDGLLIVNNYRDRDTDCAAGKVTLIAKWGEKFGRYDYLITGLVAWALTLILLVHGRVWACVLPLFFIPVHVSTWREMSVIRHGKALNRVLGLTSRNMLFYGLLLAVGLIL